MKRMSVLAVGLLLAALPQTASAQATDPAGNKGSASTTVTVSNTSSPSGKKK